MPDEKFQFTRIPMTLLKVSFLLQNNSQGNFMSVTASYHHGIRINIPVISVTHKYIGFFLSVSKNALKKTMCSRQHAFQQCKNKPSKLTHFYGYFEKDSEQFLY